ncbi:hypothetical protein TNCV_4124821 [Trichonephila clavipes]|nr:hypothetical protein TNCV_4124821 [Trichonephila clavipes]
MGRLMIVVIGIYGVRDIIVVATGFQEKRPPMSSLSEYSKEIVLQWIPGHCGVTGNELADHLANKRPSIQQTRKRNCNKIWWNNLKNLPVGPRRKLVAGCRRAIELDCFLKHLHRFHVAQAPFCTLCAI